MTAAGQPPAAGPLVVVLGSLNLDVVVAAPRVPRPGETLLAGDARFLPGGKGANQAVAAARLGAEVAFIGRTGDDDFGRRMRANLVAAGVGVDRVGTVAGTASGMAIVVVDPQGENTIVVSPGANAAITPDDLAEHGGLIARAAIGVVQLETPIDTVLRFARLCADHDVGLLLNAAPYRELPAELLRHCRCLVVNREEVAALTGVPADDRAGARRALAAAAGLGPATVIVTLGDQGALVLHDGEPFEIDAYRVPVVDSTGAGDAFVGALGAALARNWPTDRAVRYASAAAAVVCGGLGAQRPDLTPAAVAAVQDGAP
ncbi:ribokinase [Solwaraspora sp. WMMD1047]|uniref:ribokinase n=1 Tax=Solwaraspora sp. WMMD1047 TaxID=3016102 RepID=UPI002417DC4F|nr:ribokinase [Solwaraspora sp. WMMD1047]MDG4832814.1 ribokinase [Solwaraspora sp. WMMD1047]